MFARRREESAVVCGCCIYRWRGSEEALLVQMGSTEGAGSSCC